MPTIEDVIRVLLPVLSEAEIALDQDGRVVIFTGLIMPSEPA